MNQALVQGLNGFGITHEYTVKVRNLSSKTRKFMYAMSGQSCDIQWNVNIDENENKSGYEYVRLGAFDSYSRVVFEVDIPQGKEIEIVIKNTMLTGSNPTIHHAYIIDCTPENIESVDNDNDGVVD